MITMRQHRTFFLTSNIDNYGKILVGGDGRATDRCHAYRYQVIREDERAYTFSFSYIFIRNCDSHTIISLPG